MPARFDDEPQEEWAGDDPEGPQDIDLADDGADDDATDTVPCPGCGEAIPDFADRCPYCGEWVVQGGESARPMWIVIGAVVVLLTFVIWNLL